MKNERWLLWFFKFMVVLPLSLRSKGVGLECEIHGSP